MRKEQGLNPTQSVVRAPAALRQLKLVRGAESQTCWIFPLGKSSKACEALTCQGSVKGFGRSREKPNLGKEGHLKAPEIHLHWEF